MKVLNTRPRAARRPEAAHPDRPLACPAFTSSQGAMPATAGDPNGMATSQTAESPDLIAEVLILPDGQVLAHNVTPAFTALLHQVNPRDPWLMPRRIAATSARSRPQQALARDPTNPDCPSSSPLSRP